MLLRSIVLMAALSSTSAWAQDPTPILFGSCMHQDKPTPILTAINKVDADLFVFLGDNIYGDTEDMAILKKKYTKLGSKPELVKLRERMPVIAIWDDHDFGENDAGKEYPKKEESRQIMLDFWGAEADDIRRTQTDGIYTSYWLEKDGKRVHVILPDLRWNRDALTSVDRATYDKEKAPKNLGPYLPAVGRSMLGEHQWQWLEAELQKPADLTIMGSSIQALSDFTGWESWANFPDDRNRLLTLVEEKNLHNLILISGDTHWGEFSKVDVNDIPLWELTSSGLDMEWKQVSPNQNRIGKDYSSVNFGDILIDWDNHLVTMSLRDEQGDAFASHELPLSK